MVSELHDQLIKESVGGPLIVFVVCHGCSRDTVQRHIAVAFADIVFEGDRSFVTLCNSASDGSGVEIDELLGNSSLVEPQILEVHLHAVEPGCVRLPLV